MEGYKFYSAINFTPVEVEKQPFLGVEKVELPSNLHQLIWQFYKYLMRQEQKVLTCLVVEDQFTIQSAKNRWDNVLEVVLPLIGMAEVVGQNAIVQVEEEASLDQWIVVFFGVMASGKRLLIQNRMHPSCKNTLINQWIADFPFLQSFIAVEMGEKVILKSMQRSWVILLNENTDLDAVVELIIHYQVLKNELISLNELTLVASGIVQFNLEQKWNRAISSLNLGSLFDWNADAQTLPSTLNFVTELPDHAYVLDCTIGEVEVPRFDFNDILNWIKE